jgi:hypothetical protein
MLQNTGGNLTRRMVSSMMAVFPTATFQTGLRPSGLAQAPGQHGHSALPLTAINCHSLGIRN